MRFVPRWGRLAVWVVAGALTTACSGSISSDDVDRATARWEERAPPIYHWRADGEIDGRGVDLDTYAVNEVVESPVLGAADFGIDALFGEIRGAIDAGVAVTASFDDDLGYPQEVEIDGRLSLTTRDFIPLERPEPCSSASGSARDLDAEHASWLMAGFERWFDVDGCPIRLDVIGQLPGAEHCGFEAATQLQVGTPIGAPYEGAGATSPRTFVWDPDGVVTGMERRPSIVVGDLPPSAEDTGYRTPDAQLWRDRSDPGVLYRIRDGVADQFVLDDGFHVGCM